MRKLNALLLTLALLAPSFSGCASSGSALRPRLDPAVDRMLAEAARKPSGKTAADAAAGIKALRKGRYPEAQKRFEAGLRLDPENGSLHFLNGLSYHLRSLGGDQAMLQMAESGYALALRFDQDNYWASYFLGHVYFAQKRYKEAQNQFSYALLYAQEDADFLRGLAVASYYAQDLETGGWAAEKALKLDPSQPSGWRAAALLRAARGDGKGAQEALARFTELSSKAPGAAGEWTAERLAARVADWKAFHERNPEPVKAAGSVFSAGAQPEGKPVDLGEGGDNYDGDEAAATAALAEPGDAKPANSNAPRMTLVDVVIISSEENRSQSKGVNLLAGLKATLTGTLFGYKWTSARGSGGTSGRATTISPTFTLEGLDYNLNIWNDGVNKAEVLARPSLLAVADQTSQFYSGAILHVQLNSNNSDGSLVDVKVGINLSVTPTFIDDETVRVKVHADRSFIDARNEKLGFSAFSQTSQTSVDATAVLRFGETLILSGLSENETGRGKSGVPILQRIPIVQWFFSNKTESETKKSVMILLAPHKARRGSEHMTPAEIREFKKAAKQGAQALDHLKALKKKEGLAGKDNVDAVFEQLSHTRFYREFQTGDLCLDEWHNSDSLAGSLKRVLGFFWY